MTTEMWYTMSTTAIMTNSYDRTYDWVYIYDAQGRVTSATRNVGDTVETKTYTYTDAGYTEVYNYLGMVSGTVIPEPMGQTVRSEIRT